MKVLTPALTQPRVTMTCHSQYYCHKLIYNTDLQHMTHIIGSTLVKVMVMAWRHGAPEPVPTIRYFFGLYLNTVRVSITEHGLWLKPRGKWSANDDARPNFCLVLGLHKSAFQLAYVYRDSFWFSMCNLSTNKPVVISLWDCINLQSCRHWSHTLGSQ